MSSMIHLTALKGPGGVAAIAALRSACEVENLAQATAIVADVKAGKARSVASKPDASKLVKLRDHFEFTILGKVDPEPAPIVEEKPVETKPAPVPGVDPRVQAVLDLINASSLDEGKVRDIARDEARKHVGAPPTIKIEIADDTMPVVSEDTYHAHFGYLLAAVKAGINVQLVGAAASGKTTAGTQLAKLLNLPFEFTGAIDSPYKLTGFMNANGGVVHTAFRKCVENGGVFLFDEADRSVPSATVAFNAPLANRVMDFPDGAVPVHKDFIAIMGTNTYGRGGDRLYVAGNQQDAAFNDRWVTLDWTYDTRIEAAMIGLPTPRDALVVPKLSPIKVEAEQREIAHRWFLHVRSIRAAVAKVGARHLVTPRATAAGFKLLCAGWSWSFVEDGTIWKGLEKSARNQIELEAAKIKPGLE